MKTIIGLTGSFGSGCTFIYEKFIKAKGYKYLSLSQILRNIYKEEKGEECQLSRHKMQDYGNQIRKEHGFHILAKKAAKFIEQNEGDKWVIDSIRNPNEIKFLKSRFGNFFLVAIFADYETRWNRVKNTYDNDERIFKEDDKIDSNEDLEYGQRVRDCYNMADIIISNNNDCYEGSEDYTLLNAKIEKYIKLIEGENKFNPNEMEAIMAMAYANSLRSSCLKRKVGAIIIDNYGNVFSSGYNEVPIDQRTCKAERGKCYRDSLKEEFSNELGTIIDDTEKNNVIKNLFYKKFKILDYCRALHAEENAILNVAKFGSSIALRGATLYTTTYPCNLCANKIVQVGIMKIVYLEPYPMQEAKKILEKNQIEQVPFEGVSFNGYFRFMEV